jgi:hypothetical protein
MILYPPSFAYGSFISVALSTSVLNHGLTSKFWMLSDRIIMVVGSGVTIYMAPNTIIKCLVVIMGILYGLAKKYRHIVFHLGAHGLITIVNISILYTLYHNLNSTDGFIGIK